MSRGGRRRFRLDVGPQRVERDLDAELEFHLAMRARRLAERGLDHTAAREQALRQFGDLSAVRAECLTIDRERDRAMRRTIRLEDLRQDAVYAVRSLAQRKGFAAVLLLVLALGIGANAATFTLVDALLLRTLPVPHPEQLVTIGDQWRTGVAAHGAPRASVISYPLYRDVREANRVLSGLFASGRAGRIDALVPRDSGGMPRAAAGEPEHPRARYVSGNYFSVLGVRPHVGRTFGADEDRAPGASPTIVLSHGYWQRRFGGSAAVVGSTITVNQVPMTVIGVAAPGFTGEIVGQPIDLWLPVTMQATLSPNRPWLASRSNSWLLLMGRVAPGVSPEQARVVLVETVERAMRAAAEGDEVADVEQVLREEGVPVGDGSRGFSYYRRSYAAALVTLSVAVALVLLVICANVANLLLARAAARGREISVRMAIGASRLRLVQQLLIESAVLAVAGGALGTLVAMWGSRALLRLAADGPNPIPLDTRLDARVLAFTAAVALATALVFGLAPALHATRVQLAAALRTGGRSVTGSANGAGRVPLGKLLVVAQVALSTLLLVGTGMLVRSARRLEGADIGVARERLLVARLDASRGGYSGARLAALLGDVSGRVARVPGVVAVTYSENGLISGTESGTSILVEGYTARSAQDSSVAYDAVGPAYFRTAGTRLLRGRDFEARDHASAARVAIVNQSMARHYFPNADPIGRRLTRGDHTYEIVGIAADVQEQGVREPAGRRLYLPYLQEPTLPDAPHFLVRTAGDPRALVASVRRALRAADPALPVLSVDALDDLVRSSVSQDRLVSRVVSLFGALALVLAALGLYGVIAFATLRRTNEFGLRMALGASGRTVTRLVLREALALLAVGVLVGLPAAFAATPLLRDQLFGVGLVDVPSILIAVGVLTASALVAAALPARRAARVAPLEALRAE